MSQSESNNSNDCGEKRVERAKGVFDGDESVDEMIASLEEKRAELEELQEEGWELDDEVIVNDYARLTKSHE